VEPKKEEWDYLYGTQNDFNTYQYC